MNTGMAEANILMKDPSQFLGDLLIERKSKNRRYSARALARDLGLSSGFLTQVMNRSRNMSLDQRLKLATQLGLTVLLKSPDFNNDSKEKLDLLYYTIEHDKILKHWCHFAIMEMTQTGALSCDPRKIARRLGISEVETKSAIDRLIEFGYLTVTPQKTLKKAVKQFVIDAQKSSKAMRDYHESRLSAAAEELLHFDEQRVSNRHFQTLFLPTSKSKVQKAKKMITEFENQLIQFLVSGKSDEVFQMSVQLFSVDKMSETQRSPK